MQLRCNHVDYIDGTPHSLPAEKKKNRQCAYRKQFVRRIYGINIEFCQPRYGAFTAGILKINYSTISLDYNNIYAYRNEIVLRQCVKQNSVAQHLKQSEISGICMHACIHITHISIVGRVERKPPIVCAYFSSYFQTATPPQTDIGWIVWM